MAQHVKLTNSITNRINCTFSSCSKICLDFNPLESVYCASWHVRWAFFYIFRKVVTCAQKFSSWVHRLQTLQSGTDLNICQVILYYITDKIIVGSYHGMLRIFMPRSAEFKPEDLMLEIQMSQPILQVEAGRYVSLVWMAFVNHRENGHQLFNVEQYNENWFVYSRGSDKLHLGILHPRKFSVYSVSGTSKTSLCFV